MSINVDDILKEAEKLYSRKNGANSNLGLFTVMPANQWIEQAKSRPIPQMLFGELWFEGELCILFADTNLGKSILAVQIGNSISKGEAIQGFKLETQKQPILYFDFELTDKQFESRYSKDYLQHYNFNDNFIRVEINPDAEIPDTQSFEEFLSYSLEHSIEQTQAKILIVDNLTYLNNENEKAKDALPLMKRLKALKSKYCLSLLVLAHTPKRDLSKPITQNDLQGSKMLMNFCDTSFCIGKSHSDKNLRYIKQIKERYTEKIYGTENVIICQIDKPFNFLQFEFLNYGLERDHLVLHSEKDKEALSQKVIELKQKGLSLRVIGTNLGISHMKVQRILEDCNRV